MNIQFPSMGPHAEPLILLAIFFLKISLLLIVLISIFQVFRFFLSLKVMKNLQKIHGSFPSLTEYLNSIQFNKNKFIFIKIISKYLKVFLKFVKKKESDFLLDKLIDSLKKELNYYLVKSKNVFYYFLTTSIFFLLYSINYELKIISQVFLFSGKKGNELMLYGFFYENVSLLSSLVFLVCLLSILGILNIKIFLNRMNFYIDQLFKFDNLKISKSKRNKMCN